MTTKGVHDEVELDKSERTPPQLCVVETDPWYDRTYMY